MKPPFATFLHALAISFSLIAALLPQVTGAADQTATWNPAAVGNWSDPTKWSTNPLFPNNGNGGFTFDATQSSGTLTLDQAITIEKLTMSGGVQNTSSGSTLTLNDLFTWSGGSINASGTIQANGGISVSGGTKALSGRTINNTGAAIWSAGSFDTGQGAVFNNQSGATFTTSFDGSFAYDLGGAVTNFNNAGTFTKSAGAGSTTISAAFNNSGTVNANSGNLQLSGGGNQTGAFSIASGATVTFASTGQTLDTGASFSGAGTLQITATTVTANSAVSIGSAFSLASGTLTGPGTVTVGGAMTWSGGAISGTGTTQINGSLSISGATAKTLNTSRILNNGGSANWTGGSFDTGNGAVFNNQAGGTFTTNFDGTFAYDLGGAISSFNNAGTFTKSAGTVSTTFTAPFNNSGTVNVNSGNLQLSGGGTQTGAFSIASGAALTFGSVSQSLNAGTSFSGAGTAVITSTTVTVNNPVNFGSLVNLSSGNLTGAGTATMIGAMTWSGGTMNGAGTTQIDGGLTISGASSKTLNTSRIVNNSGVANWTGGSFDTGNGAVFNNQATGTFTTNFDGNFSFDLGGTTSSFNNAGTFTKSGGAGSTFISAAFGNTGTVNVNSGTLALFGGVTQHSGTTLTGGTWNVTNGAVINISTGSNITNNQGNVTLDGAGSSFAKFTTALNNNQGSLTLKNNRDLTTAGAFSNSGTMTVQDSTTVMTVGAGGGSAYTQTAGFTVLAGGAIIDASAFNLNGGTLSGTGTIDAPLSAISGVPSTIVPGASPGVISINGFAMLGANNTLAMEIGGLNSGTDYDLLAVNGTLTVGGLLDLDFINGFENSVLPSDIFTIGTSTAAILGSFSNVASGSRLSTNTAYSFEVWYGAGSPYGANNLVVTGAPEPGRMILIVLGVAGVAMRRRRK